MNTVSTVALSQVSLVIAQNSIAAAQNSNAIAQNSTDNAQNAANALLDSRITAEALRAQSKENNLTAAVISEESRASTAQDTEKLRAQNAEANLMDAVTLENSRATTSENAEKLRAQIVEANLTAAISNAIVLQTSLATSLANAIAAQNSMATKMDAMVNCSVLGKFASANGSCFSPDVIDTQAIQAMMSCLEIKQRYSSLALKFVDYIISFLP